MNSFRNQVAIQQAKEEIGSWRNDSGPIFYPGQHNDMGNAVYHDPNRSAVEVSLPHILNVNNAAAATLTVNLLGAAANYNAANFGNNVNITVTYTSNNPLVPFTYGQLLGATLGEPMQIGLIRVQAVTQGQATATMSLLRNPGVGKFEGQSLFPLVYPNQFIATITYVENAWKADKYTTLSYLQNGVTDANEQIYLYQNSNVNLDRAFSNRKVVQEYAKPQTGISQQTQIIVPAAASAALTRSGSLL